MKQRKLKVKEVKGERRQFLLGMGLFFGVFLLSYAWVLYITPIAYTQAGMYALFAFLIGIIASVVLIFTRHSLMGLGGSLASILYVVFFAITWSLVK